MCIVQATCRGLLGGVQHVEPTTLGCQINKCIN